MLGIKSILRNGEHVVKRFSGSLSEEGTCKKGTLFITNRRLIHIPSPEVKIDWKKTIVGGALFGGIGGTLGTKVVYPESFEDYHLSTLIGIEAVAGHRNTLKAVFQRGENTRTILIEVEKPLDFKSEVEKAKKHLEEEYKNLGLG